MNPPTDVPIAVVIVHLVALGVLLVRAARLYVRRFSLLYKNRPNGARASWVRLLQLSIGLTK